MTSMPASRSAAAMTRAPRSWPSSPGFPTRTRILPSMRSEPRRGLIGAKAFLQRCGDFAHGAIGPGPFAHIRLQIVGAARGLAERTQRRLGLAGVALLLHPRHAGSGVAGGFRRGGGDLHLGL